MSGIEERPNKQKEILVGDLSAELYDTIDYQERRSWKFGVFDKLSIVLGVFFLFAAVLLGTIGTLGFVFAPIIAISSIIWILEGCVKHEWVR